VLWAERYMPEDRQLAGLLPGTRWGSEPGAHTAAFWGLGPCTTRHAPFLEEGRYLRLWRLSYTVRRQGVTSFDPLLKHSLLGGVLLGGHGWQSGSSAT